MPTSELLQISDSNNQILKSIFWLLLLLTSWVSKTFADLFWSIPWTLVDPNPSFLYLYSADWQRELSERMWFFTPLNFFIDPTQKRSLRKGKRFHAAVFQRLRHFKLEFAVTLNQGVITKIVMRRCGHNRSFQWKDNLELNSCWILVKVWHLCDSWPKWWRMLIVLECFAPTLRRNIWMLKPS